MATHETGEMSIHHDGDELDDGLHTHDEHDHDDHGHSLSSMSHETARDEEEKIGLEKPDSAITAGDGDEKGTDELDKDGKKKKVVELQDQTNMLPVKQVIFVFLGLTCALFCSLLDQTM